MYVSYCFPCSYLTGVAAAQLQWHLSNIDVKNFRFSEIVFLLFLRPDVCGIWIRSPWQPAELSAQYCHPGDSGRKSGGVTPGPATAHTPRETPKIRLRYRTGDAASCETTGKTTEQLPCIPGRHDITCHNLKIIRWMQTTIYAVISN